MTLPYEERNSIVQYRLGKAIETLKEVHAVAALGFWSLAANRLYYAAYYASVALLINKEIETSTHKGALRMIQLFVKDGVLKMEDSRLLGRLFSMRQTGDYGDMFDWEEDDIIPLIPKVEEYIQRISKLLEN
ncbi:MAG: HEPN domain-containing protein [Muribaculaceae bacterium]|nr:HEPN domain-containing protein [Muribaculaceae bacterium]